jgi:hypothetical protein
MSYEDVAKLKYSETKLTDKNYMTQEIKSGLKKGNACYNSFQSLLCSHLLSRNVKLKCTKP